MEKDLEIGRCLSDDKRYADLINGLLFAGEQRIQESDLQEVDSQSFLKRGSRKKSERYRQLRRDLIKKSAFGVNFALIGVENQERVHYLMPLRTLEYDAAEYGKQAARIRKQVKQLKKKETAEFLSGFSKEDKLYPCITIVLYYGDDWDGAKSLHELIDFTDIPEELKKYVNDYPLHIFNMTKLENVDVFRTDLKQIFSFLKYAKDKSKLKELISSDPAYQELDEEAYDMIAACTHAVRLIPIKKTYRKDGKVDMCQALEEMLADEREEGREEGREETLLIMIRKKINKNMSLDMIADDLEEDIEVLRPFYEKVKAQKD